jgi:hypothetical protein
MSLFKPILKTSQIKIINNPNQKFITINTPTSILTDLTLILPDTHGAPNTILTTDGTGTLTWAVPQIGTEILATNVTTTTLILNNAGIRTTFQRSAVGQSHTLTWPNSQGTANTILTNDGTGVLSWVVPSTTNLNTTNITSDTLILNNILNDGITTSISRAYGGTSHNLTWPNAQGTANTVITNNGAGTLSWAQPRAYILSDTNSNTLFGSFAGASLSTSTGIRNCIMGASAGSYITTGSKNCLFGTEAGKNLISGNENVYIGVRACYSNQYMSDLVAVGTEAGYANVTGQQNVYVGDYAGRNALGSNHTFVGYAAGQSVVNGSDNTYVGIESGRNASDGSAITQMDGSYNTFVGNKSGFSVLGSRNTGVGHEAGGIFSGNTGDDNTCVGFQAGRSLAGGSRNTFYGSMAGTAVTTGDNNTLFGFLAGGTIDTGINNICIGSISGQNIKSGSNNICIGNNTNITTDSSSNCIVIGNNSTASTDCVVIGHNINGTGDVSMNGTQCAYFTHRTVGSAGVAANWIGNELVEATSSIKFKKNIEDYSPDPAKFDKLRPVSYRYKFDTRDMQVGFIAEEIMELYPEFTVLGMDPNDTEFYGKPRGVQYDNMVVLLVHELKRLRKEKDERVARIKARINVLRANLSV